MWKTSSSKMRDRRNTNLSVSSTASSCSTSSAPSRSSLHEKRSSSPDPPSPTLPAPVSTTTKKGKSWKKISRRLIAAKVSILVCFIVLLWWLLSIDLLGRIWISSTGKQQAVNNFDVQLAHNTHHEPSFRLVTDSRGRSRWTISVPHNASFPLRPQTYQTICRQGDSLHGKLTAKGSATQRSWRFGMVSQDQTFLDIAEAEQAGALPLSSAADSAQTCQKSLTFVLISSDVSFGKALLLLWLSYGFAKQERRAFFLDDSQWAWGKYTTYFMPLTSPKCRRPPTHHIVPCPRNARHVVVSSATAPWIFDKSFNSRYLNSRKRGVETQAGIFQMIQLGYQDLFNLSGEDSLYAASRVAEFEEEAAGHNGAMIGMHIRRGDLHPHEFQYSRDYLPLERYAQAARSLLQIRLLSKTSAEDIATSPRYSRSPLVLASDDPDIVDDIELQQAASRLTIQRAQDKIRLATKSTLDLASPVEPQREPGSAYVKHIEENSGWEGGFYSALFYSLGGAQKEAGSLPDVESIPEPALRMRELVGRAYLLDLAVLGESDGIVCAVSSATCRILAVMMGWDSLREGRWVNVDDGRPWSWDGRS